MDRTSDPDQRVEDAKQDFAARAEELGRRFRGIKERVQGVRQRFDDLRQRIDLGSKIAQRPLAAVGVAFAAGALLAMLRTRRTIVVHEQRPVSVVHEQRPVSEPGARGALAGALGAFALALIRDFAMRRVAGAASDWLDRQREASRQRESEAFMEH